MIDLNEYEMFVQQKLSKPSKDVKTLLESLNGLIDAGDKLGMRVPELLTASHGLTAESGEFAEIVKKMLYQGKPLDADNRIHLMKELGDLLFYVMVACTALGCTADEVIKMNRDKLDARYAGEFTVEESENRADGDL